MFGIHWIDVNVSADCRGRESFLNQFPIASKAEIPLIMLLGFHLSIIAYGNLPKIRMLP